jgi:hypothetical protein
MTTARRSARHTLRSSNHPMSRNTSEVLIRLTWAALSDAEDLLHLLKKLTEVHRFALAAGCDWKALSTAVVSAVLDYIRGQNPAEIRLSLIETPPSVFALLSTSASTCPSITSLYPPSTKQRPQEQSRRRPCKASCFIIATAWTRILLTEAHPLRLSGYILFIELT